MELTFNIIINIPDECEDQIREIKECPELIIGDVFDIEIISISEVH